MQISISEAKKKAEFMKKIMKFLIAAAFLNSACQMSATNKFSGMNMEISNSNSSATQIRIFTAIDLVKYVRENKTETDKMLAKQRIMVSGTVTHLGKTVINLSGNNSGEVICGGTIFYQDEWKKLDRLLSNFSKKRSLRPMATVSGIYQLNLSPDQSPNNKTSVFLEECKIETATK